MKNLTFGLLTCILFLIGCSTSSNECPICNGEGEVMNNNSHKASYCMACKGEGHVTNDSIEIVEKKMYTALGIKKSENVETIATQVGGQSMARCPMCSGTGIFHYTRYGIPPSVCSECRQTGVVTAQRRAQLLAALRQMDIQTGGAGFAGSSIEYNNSPRQNQSPRPNTQKSKCSVCHGSGRCQICKGASAPRYGDIRYCNSCANTHRCKWCAGQGFN